MKVYLCCGNKTGVRNPDEWTGFDIRRPCDVIQDVRTLDGRRFWDAEMIFATPPCDGFTDLPWRPATGKHLDVLMACWRICNEAGVPWLLENSRFARKYLGPAMCHRDSHYFWGTIPVPGFHRSIPKERMSGRNPLARAALPVFL